MTNPTSPPPAALERAREWLISKGFARGYVGTRLGTDLDFHVSINDVAQLLTEERTKALEEAAAEADARAEFCRQKDRNTYGGGLSVYAAPQCDVIARNIRSLARGEEGTEDE